MTITVNQHWYIMAFLYTTSMTHCGTDLTVSLVDAVTGSHEHLSKDVEWWYITTKIL